jgi:Iap family predicted aminopeptidase
MLGCAVGLACAAALLVSGCTTTPPVPTVHVPGPASATLSATETPPTGDTTASAAATVSPAPVAPLTFSVKRVLADSRAIEAFGVRVGGSSAEREAADYVAGRLRSMGYDVTVQKFPAPAGTSRNVIARVIGDDPRVLVLSGHLDTRSTTPGANDDAVGSAIVLEIARILASERPPTSVEFTLFGSEEYNDGASRDHHRGSRYRVAHLTKTQRANTLGMLSVDVVGYGPHLYTRTMGVGPRGMSDYLLRIAEETGLKLSYLKDPGPTGWSDHEPYEKAGIPAVWLERLQDPQYHKPGDTTAHLQSSALREAGWLVLSAIRRLSASDIRRLERR